MALEAGSPATCFTPQVVANAFVKQYYQTLRYAREDAYKFYNDSSILGRTDSDGKMVYVTTIDGIKEQLVSSDFADFFIEIETVDAQPSHVDGVLILVAGYFTTDAVKQKFTQSFFLAPQENRGYYVLNDMFRLTRIPTEVKEVVANHDNKSTQITTLPNGEVISTSANVVSPVKNDPIVETSVKVVSNDLEKIPEVSTLTAQKAVNKDFEKIPEAAPAPRAPVEKAASAPRAPAEKAAPAPRAPAEKSAPAPPPAPRVPAEKSAPAPCAPAEKSAPAPPAPAEKAAPAIPAPVVKSAPAPPASDEKEVTRKTYASIVKTMSTQPAAAARPVKPNPKPKASQNVEKNVSSPSKPAHATDNALPGDKIVPKNKSPDEPGYSIFVKNLPFDATIEMVEQEFSKFGTIKSGGIQVKCQPDQFCFGFVEFESQQSMLAAIEASSVYFGKRESYVEEKRTKTRVVDGVVTRGDDNGVGSRFQYGRGGYYGDNNKRQWGGQNNGYYHDGENARNNYSGRGGRGPQENGYPQNNGYHQNGNGYHQNSNGYSGNGYQHRRPNNSGNGRVERNNGPRQQGPAAAAS